MQASELIDHVAASTGLAAADAARVVEDVIAYFAETTEDYVRRRHRELQGGGMKNPAIWSTVSSELESRVVAAPRLSDRQLRRIVYG